MRILGIDPSLTATGLCRPDGATRTIGTRPADGDRRYQVIRDEVADVAPTADLAVLEMAPPGLKGNAIKALHMAQASVRLALLDAKVPYVLFNPFQIKRFATGIKSADKAKMILEAYKRTDGRCDFSRTGRDDNQCDAWWLRQAGLFRLGLGEISLPRAQTVVLEEIDWTGWA